MVTKVPFCFCFCWARNITHCLWYLKNFIFLKSVQYIKSYGHLNAGCWKYCELKFSLVKSHLKLSQLSYYVCYCYFISVHENNHDTSRRQKPFYVIWSQDTLQILAVILAELPKSEVCQPTPNKLCHFHPPELLRVFEIFGTFEKQRWVYNLAYKSCYKNVCFITNGDVAVGLMRKVLFTDFDYHTY